jgi:hypothetical protein
MAIAANAVMAVLAYGQLHTADAGAPTYTSNLTTAARQPLSWGTPGTHGSFALTTAVVFSGGSPGGTVATITLWSAPTGGVCYGQFNLAADTKFNSSGVYTVTAIDFNGTAT